MSELLVGAAAFILGVVVFFVLLVHIGLILSVIAGVIVALVVWRGIVHYTNRGV